MQSQPPLLLVENHFDRVIQQPQALVTATSSKLDREPWRIADYRRELTWHEFTTDGGGADQVIAVNLGAGNGRSADYVWLDRGHNLWGRTIYVEAGHDGAAWPFSRGFAVPAQPTGLWPEILGVGGDPTEPIFCVTEESSLYALFARSAKYQYWRLRFPYAAGWVPVTVGAMLGNRHHFLGFSNIYDPDQAERTELAQQSRAGWRAVDTTYSWRILQLGFTYIGRSEYDTSLRQLQHLLFRRNQPVAAVLNFGHRPERLWLFQYRGTQWTAPANRTYHRNAMTLVECGPRLD